MLSGHASDNSFQKPSEKITYLKKALEKNLKWDLCLFLVIIEVEI